MVNRSFCIRSMTKENYPEVYELWSGIPGIGLSEADSEQSIAKFLKRNKNLSFVCYRDQKIVGTILCGQDGRRGYVYHTCVLPEYHGQGIGSILVEKALNEFKNLGINKCHLFVICDNELGKTFWNRRGWIQRSDLLMYSKNI